MFDALDTSASGLTAQRVRMDTVANNVLNANTTRDANGLPNAYRRRFVVFAQGRQPTRAGGDAGPGVHVAGIEADRSPFSKRYEPGHPDADAAGYVNYPNVDLAVEMVNMMEASRAYEANLSTMETTKTMINASIRLLA